MNDNLNEVYRKYNRMLLFGIFVWPFCLLFIHIGNGIIGAGGGKAAVTARETADLLLIATIFAEVFAIVIYYIANQLFKQGDVSKALKIIKYPFYYLALFLIILFGKDAL